LYLHPEVARLSGRAAFCDQTVSVCAAAVAAPGRHFRAAQRNVAASEPWASPRRERGATREEAGVAAPGAAYPRHFIHSSRSRSRCPMSRRVCGGGRGGSRGGEEARRVGAALPACITGAAPAVAAAAIDSRSLRNHLFID